MTSEILDPKGQFNFETGLPPGFMPIDDAMAVIQFREELNAPNVDLVAEALGASAIKTANIVPIEAAPSSETDEKAEETFKKSPDDEISDEANDSKDSKEPPEPVVESTSQDKHEESEKKSKKKGKGGPSQWWFIPCRDHGEPRWVCCLGGECQSWRT